MQTPHHIDRDVIPSNYSCLGIKTLDLGSSAKFEDPNHISQYYMIKLALHEP